jgi:hypothetical protein
MICQRCHKEFKELEEHHLFPKFMDNPHGYSYENYPNRTNLCFGCHKALHQTIIIPILNKYARTLKDKGSEFWLWKLIVTIDKSVCINSIMQESYKFIFNKEFEKDGYSI